MNMNTQQLSTFLSSCGGNWRNTLYIHDTERPGGGYLMSADSDGVPVLMELGMLRRLTGSDLDPAECCGEMAQDVFETVYAKYLLWHLPSAQEHSLRTLCAPDLEKGVTESL